MDIQKSVERARTARQVFALRLRSARMERGWTQEDLAEEAGLHPTHVGRLERAETNPSIDTMEKLARALEKLLFELVVPPADEGRAGDRSAS